jgi:hypothetical protein
MDNEDAWKTSPKTMPFCDQYYQAFGSPGPNNITLEKALRAAEK